jgi:copper chaperone CopZ
MIPTTMNSSVTAELSVEGMICASCVGRVERVLKAVPGVAEAVVNLTCVKF